MLVKKTNTHQDNVPNLFKNRLPTLLTLRGNWKCAVASVSFRNDLEIDGFMDLSFTIEEPLEVDIVLQEQSTTSNLDIYRTPKKTFKVDSKLQNVDEVVNYFIDSVRHWIEVIKSPRSILTLKFNKDVTLTTSPYMTKILGLDTNITSFEISKEENDSFVSPVPIEDISLASQTFFIYSSIVDYSILGHTYANILKVVPIPANSKGKYVTVEFDKLEYIPLQNSEIQELDFSLRSLSGADLRFIENDFCEVFVNLIFKKF